MIPRSLASGNFRRTSKLSRPELIGYRGLNLTEHILLCSLE